MTCIDLSYLLHIRPVTTYVAILMSASNINGITREVHLLTGSTLTTGDIWRAATSIRVLSFPQSNNMCIHVSCLRSYTRVDPIVDE